MWKSRRRKEWVTAILSRRRVRPKGLDKEEQGDSFEEEKEYVLVQTCKEAVPSVSECK